MGGKEGESGQPEHHITARTDWMEKNENYN